MKRVLVLLLAGCATGPPASPDSTSLSEIGSCTRPQQRRSIGSDVSPMLSEPQVDRAAFTDVYVRHVVAYDSRRQAEIDQVAAKCSVEYSHLFQDRRLFAVVTPSLGRAANGNGPFLIYEWTEKSWRFLFEFGGYEYEVHPHAVAPTLIETERVNRDTIRKNTLRWDGTTFKCTASEVCEYPGE